MSDPPFRSVAAAFAMFMTAAGVAQTPLHKDSPFIPQGAATVVAAANETLEFAGVSSIGNKTDLVIYDKSVKKSRWIGIGETVEGITVLNYDARLEQAVLRVNGGQKTLTLRRGKGPLNTPAPVAPMQPGFGIPSASLPASAFPQVVQIQPPPPPSLPVAAEPAAQPAPAANLVVKPPATPEVQAKQEVEARMLVSDLLEIGMAQRKAYEEAQRKASEQPPAQAAPPPGGG